MNEWKPISLAVAPSLSCWLVGRGHLRTENGKPRGVYCAWKSNGLEGKKSEACFTFSLLFLLLGLCFLFCAERESDCVVSRWDSVSNSKASPINYSSFLRTTVLGLQSLHYFTVVPCLWRRSLIFKKISDWELNRSNAPGSTVMGMESIPAPGRPGFVSQLFANQLDVHEHFPNFTNM